MCVRRKKRFHWPEPPCFKNLFDFNIIYGIIAITSNKGEYWWRVKDGL